MKHGMLYGALALMMGLCLSASAEAAICGAGQKFGKIGTTLTANGVITSSAANVRMLAVTATGTASVFGIYDTNGLGTASNALLVLEPTAAANGTTTIPAIGMFDPPLEFSTGITVVGTNFQAATAFGCIDR